MAEQSDGDHSKAVNITFWALQLIGAVAFSLEGSAKIAGAQSMVQLFAAVGFGQWLRYLTGAMEIGGALMIIFPGTAFWGACLLAAVMAGATTANIAFLHANPAISASLMILMIIIAVGRRPKKHPQHPHGHLTIPAPHPLH